MEFDQRLERAIQRGQHARDFRDRAQQAEKLSSEELRTRYSAARLELSEHIEECLRKLGDHFPGFRYEMILGEAGWGARITRDDLHFAPGRSSSTLYSRLELRITPAGSKPIIELVAKGTIRNREALSRRHYQHLDQVDTQSFAELIDLWVLEYAEQYAAAQ
jgi:hypothetical protein